MITIQLTEKQHEVLQEAITDMATELRCQVAESMDKDFDIFFTEEKKKAVRDKYRITKNIMSKLGLNTNRF
tara:strand:+ start:278 stop:490 length:213 start_codon:yes stop_codon:yes gene_type:complete